ncbi:MAG: hypothetical protein COT90_05205 [Candidatus Diapherotrites archaeon CG10_big_fil_rev_8_21_14_0_10_31_34]|nr:MAG: hypothetical protein COT90_05205 [Candidatus Diapherotrites archaeon CG10_big_fil_rev_8_21_14_0_10_31_34]
MAIELKKTDSWAKAINAISTFISEGNFRFNDSGISFKAIDPSQIVLVDYAITKSSFDKYVIEPTYVGVDLVELNKIMSRLLPNDRMTLDLTENEMSIHFAGELSRSFRLPLIDVSEQEINVPSTKFDATIEINARIFKEALKDASLFGSSVVLRAKGNQFMIEARGSSGTLKTVAKEAKKVIVKTNSEVVSKYSLNFLSNIVKEAEPDSKIKLELKGDAPMKVSYSIGGSQIQFHLAHMIL